MATEDKIETKNDQNISLTDLIHWQDDLRKDVDFNKPDSEMTSEELAKKAISIAVDKTLEEKIGVEEKKNLDKQREQMESITRFQSNLTKLVELGKEIEKNFIWQNAYVINYFDKSPENEIRNVIEGMTSDVISSEKAMTNSERVDFAKKLLNILKVYKEKMMSELLAKQEIISALIPAFEKKLNETNFEVFNNDPINNKDATVGLQKQLKEWLDLSKQTTIYRKKAIEAVQEHIDMDEMLPNHIVKNNGDITVNVSRMEMDLKGKRMVKLINEADTAERDVGDRRSKLSELIYGKAESYMEFENKNKDNKSEEKIARTNQLEMKAWFRLVKVLYIGLWVVGIGISLLFAFESDFGSFIISLIITWIILSIIKKAFLYVTIGKTTY